MNEWMNNPKIRSMDPVKLELLKAAAAQTSGKSGKNLAPVMLALITNANKQGIRFSPDETSLIIEILKEGRPKQEQEQIERTLQMVMSVFSKHMK